MCLLVLDPSGSHFFEDIHIVIQDALCVRLLCSTAPGFLVGGYAPED